MSQGVDDIGNMAMQMMRNKPAVLAQITTDLQTCAATGKSMQRLIELIDDPSKATDGKPLSQDAVNKALARRVIEQSDMLQRCMMLLLVYTAGDGCSEDAAKLAIKCGKGDEALKAMWNAKLKGGL